MVHVIAKLFWSFDIVKQLSQATWQAYTMSRATLIWQYLTTSELLPVMLDFWRHTITWFVLYFCIRIH